MRTIVSQLNFINQGWTLSQNKFQSTTTVATMKTTLYLIAIFSALQLTTAQEISFGKCPKFSVIQNFNPQRVIVKGYLDKSMCKKLSPESYHLAKKSLKRQILKAVFCFWYLADFAFSTWVAGMNTLTTLQFSNCLVIVWQPTIRMCRQAGRQKSRSSTNQSAQCKLKLKRVRTYQSLFILTQSENVYKKFQQRHTQLGCG